ncbi:hypothetical protein GLOTRDRAFT_76447 [Gloeophyllum trabeum ATCC 11539]|uniref:DUF1868 domain-containing protein n=1 Tax=Gloeophyllum trabeum (strain ATCC 11539 / FP-39264 / Madison 617) TaxID=670483 RepID=S7RLA1_GLOTA|nr:uncharacterized protein GLOTRDRAFT_76447 [Gloeophyllum trabeum ATCC 11539]EPQ55165.1 hypothetical protein GLOTRDRAFT_76447 [Gloeophyllum trabeum ATCC 11539]
MSADLQALPNPFATLLNGIENNPRAIRDLCDHHRVTRQAASTAALLSSDNIVVDPILVNVVKEGESSDPRNSLVVWTRPSQAVKQLVRDVQRALRAIEPAIWLMPEADLHMTTMEWFHSVDTETAHGITDKIPLDVVQSITTGPKTPVLLDTPVLSFDQHALAITFLPSLQTHDVYTYLHYRRDLVDTAASVHDPDLAIKMRYAAPSAHVTIARFKEPLARNNTTRSWVEALERIDRDIVRPRQDLVWKIEGPAIMRAGTVWYGGGWTLKGSLRQN